MRLLILSSRVYLEVKPIADFARLMTAHKKAGSPARRRLSMTWVSVLFVASRTSLMISRTNKPRPMPMLSAAQGGIVKFLKNNITCCITQSSEISWFRFIKICKKIIRYFPRVFFRTR